MKSLQTAVVAANLSLAAAVQISSSNLLQQQQQLVQTQGQKSSVEAEAAAVLEAEN